MIRVYHGTDLKSALSVKKSGKLTGDGPAFGPGVCTTMERALNFSAIKAMQYGLQARKKGRVLSFYIPEEMIARASKENCIDAFTLNDEKGNPLQFFHTGEIEILTIFQAQRQCTR